MNMSSVQKLVESEGIVFLSYGGFMSQELISAMTEALEKETQESDVAMNISTNIFTVFIELSQNMMNYSKSKKPLSRNIVPGGLIVVSKNSQGSQYYIHSQNIISIDDKNIIEPKFEDISTLDKNGIKERYRELRRSGKGTHAKGGGIGFYEIAKRCDEIEYDFKPINEDKYYFHIKATIDKSKK